jgi:hypothetical protein
MTLDAQKSLGPHGPNSSGAMPGGSVLGEDNVVFGTANTKSSEAGGGVLKLAN